MTHEELWLQERPRLVAQLRRRLSKHDAEDVVDETFARLRGAGVTPARLWGTALRVEQGLTRAKLRREYAEEQADFIFGQAIPSIETAILRADFDRAFRRLPRAQQEAFALVELRGLTEIEAAEYLGVAQQTINWRCETARSRLKEDMAL